MEEGAVENQRGGKTVGVLIRDEEDCQTKRKRNEPGECLPEGIGKWTAPCCPEVTHSRMNVFALSILHLSAGQSAHLDDVLSTFWVRGKTEEGERARLGMMSG